MIQQGQLTRDTMVWTAECGMGCGTGAGTIATFVMVPPPL